MPRGPKGEKRPADVIGAAIMVGRIATGEIEDNRLDFDQRKRRRTAWAPWGLKGGKARAANMSPEKRAEIARKAAKTRWNKE